VAIDGNTVNMWQDRRDSKTRCEDQRRCHQESCGRSVLRDLGCMQIIIASSTWTNAQPSEGDAALEEELRGDASPGMSCVNELWPSGDTLTRVNNLCNADWRAVSVLGTSRAT